MAAEDRQENGTAVEPHRAERFSLLLDQWERALLSSRSREALSRAPRPVGRVRAFDRDAPVPLALGDHQTPACSREHACSSSGQRAFVGSQTFETLEVLPNGSRLSCGRNARGRKELEPQTKRLASEATQLFPTCERPAASSAC